MIPWHQLWAAEPALRPRGLRGAVCTDTEAELMRLRETKSLGDTAKIMGVTKERVRQIERKLAGIGAVEPSIADELCFSRAVKWLGEGGCSIYSRFPPSGWEIRAPGGNFIADDPHSMELAVFAGCKALLAARRVRSTAFDKGTIERLAGGQFKERGDFAEQERKLREDQGRPT